MSRYKKIESGERTVVCCFLAIESILYVTFLIMDVTGRSSFTILPKYAGILLCLLFALHCAVHGGDRLVPAALLLTAAADSMLLVLDQFYVLGICVFLCVQMIYMFRIRKYTGRIRIPARILLPILAAVILRALRLLTPLNLLAGLYFSQLLINAFAVWPEKEARWRVFALGLTLFIGCDLCVGIRNSGMLFPEPMRGFARVGMWMFYLPSQVMIALSAIPSGKESRPCPTATGTAHPS